MPELPDVEVFRQYVDATSLHQRVDHLHVRDEALLRDVSRQKLVSAVVGTEFERTARHGKFLGLHSTGGPWLLLHFGMTGGIRAHGQDKPAPPHTALALDLANGLRLAYTNTRRLGMIGLADDFQNFVGDQELGPDALDLQRHAWVNVLSGRRGAIKSLLMNQEAIAGLGNEYADEALFHARMRPDRPVDDLSDDEVVTLHRQIQRVLKLAIERRVDPERMPASWLRQAREPGAPCPRCDGHITKAEIGGRSTYWCPECQS